MKRFYKTASHVPEAGGHAVHLDGRPIRTPGKAALLLPTAALAAAIAEEWRAQGDDVLPDSMPLTRLANSVIDGIMTRRADILADMAAYGETDLVCYRAERPDSLVVRQARGWQPLLDWLETRHAIRLHSTAGIMPRPQDPAALARLRMVLDAVEDPWLVGPLHMLTTAAGSVVIALAVLDGHLDAAAAFSASELDEAHQRALWGEDREAAQRQARLRADMEMAARFMDLVRAA